MVRQPVIATRMVMNVNVTPNLSKENKGKYNRDKKVKIGENKRIINVFCPIKQKNLLIFSESRLYKYNDILMAQ